MIVFIKIGGLLPGMTEAPGIKRLETDLSDADDHMKKLDDKLEQFSKEHEKYREGLQNGTISDQKFAELENSLNNEREGWAKDVDKTKSDRTTIENELRGQQYREYLIAAILYVAVGTILAGVFATDRMTALVIGAGWTSLISQIQQKGNDLKWDQVIGSTLNRADNATGKASDALNQNSKALARLLATGEGKGGLSVPTAPFDRLFSVDQVTGGRPPEALEAIKGLQVRASIADLIQRNEETKQTLQELEGARQEILRTKKMLGAD